MAVDDGTLTLILEFLLCQPIPNSTLSALISSLPLLRTFSRRLHHSILLRQLTFPFSEKTLTSLELLHQFHNNSKSLQSVYSAVAVYLTVSTLQKEDVAEFFKAVESLWRKRFGDLEKGEDRVLIAEGLRRERRTMEKAVGSELVREELRRSDVSGMAAEAVEIFLKEAVVGLGLTGLEVAAEVVRRSESCVEGKRQLEVPAEKTKISNIGECSGSGFEKHQGKQGFGNDYVMAEEPLPACTEVAEKSFPTNSKVPCQAGRNEVLVPAAQIEACDGGERSISGFNQQPVLKPIRRKCQLKQGHEKDPVMTKEPLLGVETAKTSEEERENHRLVDIEHAPDLSDGPTTTNTSDGHNKIHNDVLQPNAMERETNQFSSRRSKRLYSLDKGKKPSIMERNPTARTHQWHEESSNSSFEEESPISKQKRCKNPQQERKISVKSLPPLDISVGGPVKREWTLDEDDSLRKAVTKHGTGDWNLIRSTYPEFQGRTLEGVRNKWRHMNRKLGSKENIERTCIKLWN